MTLAIVIVVLLSMLGYFYLNCSVMGSLSTMMILIISSFLSFSCYEKLAELFVSRGYGIQWAQMGSFVLIYILSFALLRILHDVLVGSTTIDLGNPVKIGTALACGLISGIIVSGNLIVVLGLVPVQSKFVYSRFDPDSQIIVGTPQKSFLNTDGFVTGLYSMVSRGSLSGPKSFAVLHADYLSQIHLNRIKTNDDVLAVTSRKSLVLPSGSSKNPVRIWESPDRGKVVVVRMGLVAEKIQSGGAIGPDAPTQIKFCPAQIRMIYKPSSDAKHVLDGSGKVLWPLGLYKDGKLVDTKLNDTITTDIKTARDRTVWFDVVFEMPGASYEGVLLEFKQNALVKLPATAVPMTEESERALDEEEKEAYL